MVYVSFLMPGKFNATIYEAVLVVMDVFPDSSPCKSKASKMLNKHMREYFLWAERQASRNVSGSAYIVKQVLTNKDSDFCK